MENGKLVPELVRWFPDFELVDSKEPLETQTYGSLSRLILSVALDCGENLRV